MPGSNPPNHISMQLLRQLSIGIIVVDENGTVIWANEKQEEYSGLQPENVIGESFFDYAGFKDSGLDEILRSVLRDGVKWSNPEPAPSLNKPAGKKCRTEFIPIYNKGAIIGAAILFWDITDHVNAMNEAEKAKRQFASVLKLIGEDVFIIDRAFHIQKISRALIDRLKNLQAAKIVGDVCYNIFYDKNEPCENCPSIVTFEKGVPHQCQMQNETLDKIQFASSYPISDEKQNVFQAAVNCLGFKNAHSKPAEFILSDKEVKEKLNDLQALNLFNMEILNAIHHNIVVIDEDFSLLFLNKSAQISVNKPAKELVGNNIFAMLPEYNPSELQSAIDECFHSGQTQSLVVKRKGTLANDKFFKFTLSRLSDYAGVNSIILISERLPELEKLDAQSICFDKYQSLSLFSTHIVHDLRNPLSTLMTRLDLLRNADLHIDGGIHVLMNEVDALQEQANRLALILEKIEALQAQSDEEITTTELPTVIERAAVIADLYRPFKSVHVELDLPEGMPPLMCMESRLEKAFYEIFKNALEAVGEKGQVKVTAKYCEDDEEYFIIKVKDTGCGIEPENMNKLYDAFYSTKKGGKGAGLGLTVAYAAIVQHKGKIDFSSVPNKGTEVLVFLPQKIK